MGRAKLLGILFFICGVLGFSQRPPNDLFPKTILKINETEQLDFLSNRSAVTLTTVELLQRANLSLQSQRYKEALQDFELLCDRNPHVFSHQFGRAAAAGFLLSGDFGISDIRHVIVLRSSFAEAVRLRPSSLLSRRALLHVYLALPRLLGGGEAKAWEQVKAIKEISDFEGIMAALFFSAQTGNSSDFDSYARSAYAHTLKSFAINDSRYELAVVAQHYFADKDLAQALYKDYIAHSTAGDLYPPVYASYRLAELTNDGARQQIESEIPEIAESLLTYDRLTTYIRSIKSK
jgi:hypothetical protein